MKYCFLIFALLLPCTLAVYDNTWVRHTSIYHIFVWTFKDSNGDGIGDIKGITSKLDHFVDIGVETIYLSPFYSSAMVDCGYDITNFADINPDLGTLADFDELISEATKRGLKVIIDLVINHSSDEHEWFQKSVKKIDPYTDYYIWKDAKGTDENGKPIPPSNWISVFMGPAWEWNEERKQFYFHQFHKKQPDLDLRNKVVKKEILKLIKFWLDKGIGGFRVDAPIFYMEDPSLRDEPLTSPNKTEIHEWLDLWHQYTVNLPESNEFTRKLYSYVKKYSKQKGDYERIFATEVYGYMSDIMKYYRDSHFPFNYWFIERDFDFIDATGLEEFIKVWPNNAPKGKILNWAIENHDNGRVIDKFKEEKTEILMAVMMMMPGVVTVFYGYEIGLSSYPVRPERARDKGISVRSGKGRDLYRLPMQWDDTLNAGFSTKHETWLPVNPNYWRVNVRNQKNQPISRYNLFKTLSSIRRTDTGKLGELKTYVVSKSIHVFTRSLPGKETYVVVSNTGTETEYIYLSNDVPQLPPLLTVVTMSENSGYKPGDIVHSNPQFPEVFIMRPHSVLVLKTEPKSVIV